MINMTEENNSDPIEGLPIGGQAPQIETRDIYDNDVNLRKLLRDYNGVLIDFFRGAW